MPSRKNSVGKILIVSLSNIGDVILTFPVIDHLKEQFPDAAISVIVGPKAEELLRGNDNLDEVIVFDKHQPALAKLKWVLNLRRKRFDFIVDLRNTAIKLFLMPIKGTSVFTARKNDGHMRYKHLNRLKSVLDIATGDAGKKTALCISEQDQNMVDVLFKERKQCRYIVVSPSAADKAKRWPIEGYAEVCDYWAKKYQVKIVFVGDGVEDKQVADDISFLMNAEVLNLCGKVTLVQLAEVLKYCLFAFGNDSAVMHMASYLDKPVLTLFGPTDPLKYGPWSSHCHFLKKESMSFVRYHDQDWNNYPQKHITVGDVLDAVTVNNDVVHFNYEKRI